MESIRGGKLADLGETLDAKLKAAEPTWGIAEWALRWLKAKENVAVILSGMSTLEQGEENVAVFETADAVTKEQEVLLATIATELKARLSVPCTAGRYCCRNYPKGLETPTWLEV